MLPIKCATFGDSMKCDQAVVVTAVDKSSWCTISCNGGESTGDVELVVRRGGVFMKFDISEVQVARQSNTLNQLSFALQHRIEQ